MPDRDLSSVATRLEAAVIGLSTEPASADDLYAVYEMIAVQILDSEHQDFPDGVLEAYLLGYLAALPLSH